MLIINPFIDLPMGFGMALIQNTEALKYFENLSDNEKKQIVNKTNFITSKQEMQSYVDGLGKSIMD